MLPQKCGKAPKPQPLNTSRHKTLDTQTPPNQQLNFSTRRLKEKLDHQHQHFNKQHLNHSTPHLKNFSICRINNNIKQQE
jgi:hypothetical protein